MDMNTKPDEEKPSVAEPEIEVTAPSLPKKKTVFKLKKSIKKTDEAPRGKTQIAFPWYDLDSAIGVVRGMIEAGGLPMTRDQLAGKLGITASGGTFILRTSAARMFGFIEPGAGKFQLTALGFDSVSKDEAKEKVARAQAFLNVPLYRRLYDEFKGKQLPPRPLGLENTLVNLGVLPKSRQSARQVFERSARQSGFLSVDPDRLIEPIIGATIVGSADMTLDNVTMTAQLHTSMGLPATKGLDELVLGLLKRLPEPGKKWTAEQKARWLRALSQNLDFVYELEDGSVVAVEIKHLKSGKDAEQ